MKRIKTFITKFIAVWPILSLSIKMIIGLLFEIAGNFLHEKIARSCALYYRVGKGGTFPRISALYMGLFVVAVTVNIICDTLATFTWYNGIFIGILVLLTWTGFDWLGAGFFSIWPVKFEELDDFQKYTFSRVNFHELTEDQAAEVVKIIEDNDHWF